MFELFTNTQKAEQTYPLKELRIIHLKQTKRSSIDNSKVPNKVLPKITQKDTLKDPKYELQTGTQISSPKRPLGQIPKTNPKRGPKFKK